MDKDWIKYDSTTDSRKRKTHYAVEHALLELLKEKRLDQITVLELAARADINRKTFYNNYDKVEDVANEIEKRLFHLIFDSLPQRITIENEYEIFNAFQELYTKIVPYKEILKEITINHYDYILIQHFREEILPYLERCLLLYKIDPVTIPYINSFLVNGLSALFNQWLTDSTLTEAQISKLSYNLTISVIDSSNFKNIC